jgi:hypothetical protein
VWVDISSTCGRHAGNNSIAAPYEPMPASETDQPVEPIAAPRGWTDRRPREAARSLRGTPPRMGCSPAVQTGLVRPRPRYGISPGAGFHRAWRVGYPALTVCFRGSGIDLASREGDIACATH